MGGRLDAVFDRFPASSANDPMPRRSFFLGQFDKKAGTAAARTGHGDLQDALDFGEALLERQQGVDIAGRHVDAADGAGGQVPALTVIFRRLQCRFQGADSPLDLHRERAVPVEKVTHRLQDSASQRINRSRLQAFPPG